MVKVLYGLQCPPPHIFVLYFCPHWLKESGSSVLDLKPNLVKKNIYLNQLRLYLAFFMQSLCELFLQVQGPFITTNIFFAQFYCNIDIQIVYSSLCCKGQIYRSVFSQPFHQPVLTETDYLLEKKLEGTGYMSSKPGGELTKSRVLVFKASALWADAFYTSKCPSVRVCVCVCMCVCSLLRYRLNVFLPPLPKVGCPIFLDIRKNNRKKWSQT